MWILTSDDSDVVPPVVIRLTNETERTVGRATRSDFVLDAALVSRIHCRLTTDARGDLTVEDLDSTNGTFVNGQRIEEATLSDGDLVVIADVEFTFFSGLAQVPRKTVTQVIGFREADSTSLKASDVVRSLRRLQETVLQASTCVGRRNATRPSALS